MPVHVYACADHGLSPAGIEALPRRLAAGLGGYWFYSVSPQFVDRGGAELKGPDHLVTLTRFLLMAWSPWRWRGFVSEPAVRTAVRCRMVPLMRTLSVRDLAWVPDHELLPELEELHDLVALATHLRATWGPPSDVESFDPDLVAAAKRGQVRTWYLERLMP